MSEITIEEVQLMVPMKMLLGPKACGLIDLAISQSETIKSMGEELSKVKQERDDAYERAAQVCDDYARRESERAVVVCDLAATAIRALKAEPTDEVKR